MNNKKLLWILSILGILLWMLMVPAVFSKDDALFLQMTDNYAHGRGFQLWNGETETRSEELRIFWQVKRNGKYYSSRPPFYVYFALPFYRAFGVKGLFYVNMISLMIAVILLTKLSDTLIGSSGILVSIIFLTSTYIVEYGIGIWPHTLSLLLVLTSILLQVKYFKSMSIYYIIATGFVIGVATGVRIMNAVYLGVIGLGCLIYAKRRLIAAAGFVLGILPPLLLFCYINLERYGIFYPFVYSNDFSLHFKTLIYSLTGFGTVLGLVFVVYLAAGKIPGNNKKLYYSFITLFIIIFFMIIKKGFIHNFYTYVFDLSRFPPVPQPGQERSAITNAVLYGNIIKKALLQSCPFLLLALPTICKMAKSDGLKDWKNFILVANFLVGPIFLASYKFHDDIGYHGGLGSNMRFFIDALPFGIMLAVLTLRNLPSYREVFIPALASGIVFVAGSTILKSDRRAYEYYILYFPLFLMLLFFISFACFSLIKNISLKKRFGFITYTLAVIMIVYSAAGTTLDDFITSRRIRKQHQKIFEVLDKYVGRDALIFVYWGQIDTASMLKPNRVIRIADVHKDNGKSIRSIIDRYTGNNKTKIYFWVSGWEGLFAREVQSLYPVEKLSSEKKVNLYRLKQ